LCILGKQYAQAATFGMYWEPIAKELANLSESQPVIAKAADILITAGPYAALISVATPFAMQTAANYGLIDAKKAVGSNIVPPAVLEAQMKARMAEMEAQAIREQQAAMQRALQAQQEYERVLLEAENAKRAAAKDGVDNHGWDPNIHDTTPVSQ
jgi:hypothetical protein